jgi:hypothetical protein
VLCRMLGALPSAFCRALGKVLLSVTTTFAESSTLGTGIHSAKISLPSAKHLAKGGSRQRAVSRRLKLTAVTFTERKVLALGKESSLPSAPRLTLGEQALPRPSLDTRHSIFLFFYFAHQTFCGMFLHYVNLHVPFWDNYKSVFITIGFSSFI